MTICIVLEVDLLDEIDELADEDAILHVLGFESSNTARTTAWLSGVAGVICNAFSVLGTVQC